MWSTTTFEAFHGTTLAAAESILRDGFKQSERDYDWLGDGVCFFQDGPYRAREWALNWAVRPYRGEAAVVGATIRLERATLMDLIDIRWCDWLKRFYEGYVKDREFHNKAIPKQRPHTSGAHRLDCQVVNEAVIYWRKKRQPISAVRGAFEEGDRVYPTSAFYDRAHVQIAIRDLSLVNNAWIEQDIE
ncbi:MAG TPA: hypothetical protein VKM93_14935 [Terriglobia bacterium]|nr:hypothetical protein [Terriglobia bacterium]